MVLVGINKKFTQTKNKGGPRHLLQNKMYCKKEMDVEEHTAITVHKLPCADLCNPHLYFFVRLISI